MRVNLDRKTAKQMHKVYRSKEVGSKLDGTPLAELYPMKKACRVAEILIEMETMNYDR